MVELDLDALRDPGEVGRVGQCKRVSTPIKELLQLFITPPRLGDVMVGKQTTIARDEKSRAKKVELQRRSLSLGLKGYHAPLVDQRFTGRIGSNTNDLPGIFILKFHDYVQQANTRSVFVNNRFSCPTLSLKPIQLILRLLKLPLERFVIRDARRCHFFANRLTLGFQ